MTWRRIVIGILGITLAVVWAMAFLYQRYFLHLTVAILGSRLRMDLMTVLSLWSLLQTWITALLVVPVTVASIGAMLGARSMVRILRITAAATAALSAGTLFIYVSLIAPSAIKDGALLPYGRHARYELLAAGVALVLQLLLLRLLRWSAGGTSGEATQRWASRVVGEMSDKAMRPSSRDTQLIGSLKSPLAARD